MNRWCAFPPGPWAFDGGRFFGIAGDDPDYANTSWRLGVDLIHRFNWLP